MSARSLLSRQPGGSISRMESDPLWETACWYAIHTRSRHEKVVEQELAKKQIETFLPVRCLSRQWSDRRKTIEEPLFKGYLFVHMPLKERLEVLRTTGVVRLVGPPGLKPVAIRDQDLFAVRRFMEEDMVIDPFPYLREGMKVYVRSGPFQGVEGFLVRKDRHSRLVISLDLLMQSASVVIDGALVEPV